MAKTILTISVIILSLFAGTGVAQTAKSVQTRRINRYVKQLEKYVDKPSNKCEIYANVSTGKKDRWRRFRFEKSLEKSRESHEADEIAYVWRNNGKVLAVNFTFTSESGDWAHYVFYRFRPDGSLAKIEADLRTFYGDLSVQRGYYYSTGGRLISKHTRFRDLTTDKPKKPGDDFYDEKVNIYKTTGKLPFAKLLRKTRGG
jgi:hypothetical protein